jgi:transcriptional regulator with XRE-family HTH domain
MAARGADDVKRALTPREVFGQQLRAIRRRQGLTQKQLAETVSRIYGVPIRQSAIAGLENTKLGGVHRDVSLEEVFAFALALEVSPSALLVPRDSETRMTFANVTPDNELTVSGADILEWIRGTEALPGTFASLVHRTPFHDERPDWEVAAMREYPMLQQIVARVARVMVLTAEHGADADETRTAVESLERISRMAEPRGHDNKEHGR